MENKSLNRKYCGLLNTGNTCYLNSVLQSLFHNEDMRQYLSGNPSCKGEITKSMSDLFNKMETSDMAIDITNLKCKLGKKFSFFNSKTQEDSHEALISLLYCLNSEGLKDTMAIDNFESIYTSKFYSKESKAVTCASCNNVKCVPTETHSILSIPMAQSFDQLSLQLCISEYLAPKLISSVECENCNGKHPAIENKKFTHLPANLIINLIRFDYDFVNKIPLKDNRSVKCPNSLLLTQFNVHGLDECSYELNAFITHEGQSTTFGHYVAYCKIGKKWIKFDDSVVTEISSFNLDPSTAYIIFYRKTTTKKIHQTLSTKTVVPKPIKHEIKIWPNTQTFSNVEVKSNNHALPSPTIKKDSTVDSNICNPFHKDHDRNNFENISRKCKFLKRKNTPPPTNQSDKRKCVIKENCFQSNVFNHSPKNQSANKLENLSYEKCIILKRKNPLPMHENKRKDDKREKELIGSRDTKTDLKNVHHDHSYIQKYFESSSVSDHNVKKKKTITLNVETVQNEKNFQFQQHTIHEPKSKKNKNVLPENASVNDQEVNHNTNKVDKSNDSASTADSTEMLMENLSLNKTHAPNMSQENAFNTNSNKRRSRVRKCAALLCESDESTSLFRFPSIKTTDVNLNRCKIWVRNSGNESLLCIPLEQISKKEIFLCQNHFELNQFTSTMKKRLKHTSVPTIFDCEPINKVTMNKYFRIDVTNECTENEANNNSPDNDQYNVIRNFEQEMKKLNWHICMECKEKRLDFGPTKCSHKCANYSVDNDMDPRELPKQLMGLSFVEEQLIALNHPCVSFFKLKGLQYGYSGNVITFPQNVHNFVKKLPHKVTDLRHILTVKYSNNEDIEPIYFQVRSKAVFEALCWLKENNPFYQNIEICEKNLELLPTNGSVYNEITTIHESSKEQACENVNLQTDHDEEMGHVQFSGLVQNLFPQSDDQVRSSVFDWPSISSIPINEFDTPGYIACAFPTLFPMGNADLRTPRKIKINPSDYFKHLMRFYDDRFAKHPTFRFFALNSWMRWTSLTNGNLFVKRNDKLSNITIPDLKSLILEDNSIVKKILYQGSNLRGTRSYWYARYGELIDMVEQLGMPTIYFTLSSADLHWPDLYRLLSPDKDPSSLSETDRRKLLQENPLVVDTFFSIRVEKFIKKLLIEHFHATDYWYRYEWQHRGSPHIHGIAWLSGAPNVTNLENASNEDRQKVANYFDALILAVNPNPNIQCCGDHPCRTLFQDTNNVEDDLSQLLVKVQRHKCSNDYCLRKKKSTNEKSCRFRFPFQIQEYSSIDNSDSNELQFLPKRNDPYLNKFNLIVTLAWRANSDISAVLTKHGLQNYLSKYIAKAEVTSVSLHDILNILLNDMNPDDHVKKALGKLYIKMSSERDFSAQEVCHLLTGVKLFSAGDRKFVVVNFSKSKEWVLIKDGENAPSQKSAIEKYQNRPATLENHSLWNVCKYYDLQKWHKKKKFNIVRVFPKLKIRNNAQLDEQFYRQRVLLHIPWRDESEFDIFNSSWKQTYENKNIAAIDDSRFKLNVPAQTNESDLEETSLNEYDQELNEAMVVARFGSNIIVSQNLLGLRTSDELYDWNECNRTYSNYGSPDELQNYIHIKKKYIENDLDIVPQHYDCHLNFSEEQKQIVNLVNRQVKELKQQTFHSQNNTPKRIIVQGKAGTGKSAVIQYITHSLQGHFGKSSYLLLGPTGIAALNIGGETIHSALKIPTHGEEFVDLTGESAKDFCEKMVNVNFIIIDEYSMIGCNMLNMIDRRCKQGKGSVEPFGNLIVYLLGDMRQLPPVIDPPLYGDVKKLRTLSAFNGKNLLETFQVVFHLNKCFRQQDQEFQNILDDISVGNLNQTNYNILSSRFYANVIDTNTFKSEIHLFSKTSQVDEHNVKMLTEMVDQNGLLVPVARIKAQDNCKHAKNEKSNSAGGLEPILYLSKGCKIMLRANLWTRKGLVNGSIGEVVDILYKIGEKSPDNFPVVILCKFKSYTGPGIGTHKDIVPIPPTMFTWKKGSETFTRVQFPLTLSYACTIHKSQGLTLEKAVVDVGEKEFALGIVYVALSRVKTLDGLLLYPFKIHRVNRIKNSSRFMSREECLEKLLQKKNHDCTQ